MPDDARDLICLITHGTDHELSSVGLTIANGDITAGLKVSIFLSSSGVDLVRKARCRYDAGQSARAARQSHQRLHGARRDDLGVHAMRHLLEGVVISDASVVHERIKTGAATLSF
jgi:hypothetical protein